MENQTALEKINEVLKFDTDETFATAYGISQDGEKLKCEVIKKGSDVYELMENLDDLKVSKAFDYLSIITWGWAAPLKSNGEIDGAPSCHPERRRVKLIISGSSDEKGLIGSALTFSDSPENTIFDFGDATGSLSDVFQSLFED